MGSTLLEFENVPWAALYPTSVQSLCDRLVRMRRRAPELSAMIERFQSLLEKRREAIRSEMREYRIGPLVAQLLRDSGVAVRPGELPHLVDAYYAPIRRQVSAYPDADATLSLLRAAGYRIGLLSNTCFRARDHREELSRFGLLRYFDTAYFTSSGTYRKPHPAPFRHVAQKLGVAVKRCVYVGDRQK